MDSHIVPEDPLDMNIGTNTPKVYTSVSNFPFLFEDIKVDLTVKSSGLRGKVELSDQEGTLQEEIRPEPEITKQFILQRRTVKGSQSSAALNLSECNTERSEYSCQQMYHGEGGWPRDVNISDPGQLVRWRRKVEKEEKFVCQVLKISEVSHAARLHLLLSSLSRPWSGASNRTTGSTSTRTTSRRSTRPLSPRRPTPGLLVVAWSLATFT